MEAVQTFKPKLNELRIEMKELHEIRRMTIFDDIQELYSSNSLQEKLRFECDQKAIEFYVNYRLFTNDIRDSIKLLGLALS